MDNKKQTSTPISKSLLHLYDDFTTFNEDCAFLCDAFAKLILNNESISPNTAAGFANHTETLKQTMNNFKDRLNQIREESTA